MLFNRVLLIIVIIISLIGYVNAHNPFPEDLKKIADTLGCDPIQNKEYDDPVLFEGRSFAYGYIRGLLPDESVVFWCKKRNKDIKPYLLVIMVKGKVVETINWENHPGGLDPNFYFCRVELTYFNYIDNPKESGPKGAYCGGRSRTIVDWHDGMVTVFYKYKNRWLVYMTD